MPIVTRCPKCTASYQLADESVGRQAKCKCGHLFVVTRTAYTPAIPGHPMPEAAYNMPPRRSGTPWMAGVVLAALVIVGAAVAYSIAGRGHRPTGVADATRQPPRKPSQNVDSPKATPDTKQPRAAKRSSPKPPPVSAEPKAPSGAEGKPQAGQKANPVAVVPTRRTFGQGAIPLEQAVEEGLVKAEFTGIGGSTGDVILASLKRQVAETLRLTITPGTVFMSISGNVQNMAASTIKGERAGPTSYSQSNEIVLADDQMHAYVIEAYCMDFHKDNPGAADRFTIAPPDDRAKSILTAGMNKSASINAIQSALWMERDGVSSSELQRRFPATDGDIATARSLLKEKVKASNSR